MEGEIEEKSVPLKKRHCVPNAVASSARRDLSIHDVVCGRGGLSNHHDGSRVYRRLVSESRPIFTRLSNRSMKRRLARSILAAVQRNGGHFLREKDGVWIPVAEDQAIGKILQGFRETPRERRNVSSTFYDVTEIDANNSKADLRTTNHLLEGKVNVVDALRATRFSASPSLPKNHGYDAVSSHKPASLPYFSARQHQRSDSSSQMGHASLSSLQSRLAPACHLSQRSTFPRRLLPSQQRSPSLSQMKKTLAASESGKDDAERQSRRGTSGGNPLDSSKIEHLIKLAEEAASFPLEECQLSAASNKNITRRVSS